MSQSPYAINPALTALAVDYARINKGARGYIADQVLPRSRVDDPAFIYTSYPIEEAFTVPDTKAGRTGNLNEINLTGTQTPGAVTDWGLTAPVPYRDELAARNQKMPLGPRARAVYSVVEKVQLAREVRAANLLFTAGNYLSGYKATLSGTGQWSDLTNSDPVATVQDAAAGMLIPPNVGVTSLEVANMLRRNPQVSKAAGGSAESGRLVPLDDIASLMGLEKIIVGNTLQQTSKRGQSLTTSKIWGKHFALLRLPPLQADGSVLSPDDYAFALTFHWNDQQAGENQIPAGKMGLYGGVEVYYGESLVEQLISQYAGYLFTNAIA